MSSEMNLLKFSPHEADLKILQQNYLFFYSLLLTYVHFSFFFFLNSGIFAFTKGFCTCFLAAAWEMNFTEKSVVYNYSILSNGRCKCLKLLFPQCGKWFIFMLLFLISLYLENGFEAEFSELSETCSDSRFKEVVRKNSTSFQRNADIRGKD